MLQETKRHVNQISFHPSCRFSSNVACDPLLVLQTGSNIQQEQLHVQLTDAQKEVEEYILAEMAATDMLEKKDIRKKAAEAKKKMDKLQHDLPKRRKEIQDEAQAEIDRFNQSQEINPLLLINIVLKF